MSKTEKKTFVNELLAESSRGAGFKKSVRKLISEELKRDQGGATEDSISKVVQCGRIDNYHVNTLQSDYNEDQLAAETSALLNLEKEELYEQQYWDRFESISKKASPKLKPFTANANELTEQRFNSYRKTTSKVKVERRFPSYYTFDKSTSIAIEKMINVRQFGEYHDVIGKGRHSIVVRAGHTIIPHHVIELRKFENAVKVYKLSDNEGKNKAIFKRTQREYDRLKLLRLSCSGSVPHPVGCYKNVIVMSYLGSDEEPAVSITRMPLEESMDRYYTIVNTIHWWYDRNHIVHGKMSTENILIWRGNFHYIGWSHSVRRDHPLASKKLMMDCVFITKFFESRNVPVSSTEDLFMYITNTKNISREVLDVIPKDLHKNKTVIRTNPNAKYINTGGRAGRNHRFK